MEPLYTTQFAHTLEEYIKFNKSAIFTKKKLIFTMILCAFASIIASYMITKNILLSVIISLIATGFTILIVIVDIKKEIKKAYYSNKTIDNEISDYKFYETEFTETDSHGSTTFPYTDLTRIIETKTNFYLMISNQQGYLIKKDNCSPELIAFLSELKNKIN